MDYTGMVVEYYDDNGDPKVVIREGDFKELVENKKFLMALQAAGVDNWDGYDYAQEMVENGDV